MPLTHHLIDFDNSEIAFRNRSNAELRRAHLLFKVMNNAGLVKTGKQLVNLAFAIRFPISGILRKTIYRQFVGGMSIDDCAATIEKLAARNVGTILDFAVEGEERDDLFDATCAEVIRTVEFAHNNRNVPFSASKISLVGRFVLLA